MLLFGRKDRCSQIGVSSIDLMKQHYASPIRKLDDKMEPFTMKHFMIHRDIVLSKHLRTECKIFSQMVDHKHPGYVIIGMG